MSLQDALIRLDLVAESKHDSSKKLLSTAISSAEYSMVHITADGTDALVSYKQSNDMMGQESKEKKVDCTLGAANDLDRAKQRRKESKWL